MLLSHELKLNYCRTSLYIYEVKLPGKELPIEENWVAMPADSDQSKPHVLTAKHSSDPLNLIYLKKLNAQRFSIQKSTDCMMKHQCAFRITEESYD